MHTGSPPMSRVITMVLFALSCIGLLLFLWLSFGGTIPLGAQGYRVNVSFPDAQDLATQADVRIAGVTVGKVVSTELDPKGNRTLATLQIQSQYAPIRKDTRAILRTKTILGETYVQLTPGRAARSAASGRRHACRAARCCRRVQLSDIFNALDPTTRHAFQVWQQELATAVNGNDQNLNDVLGNLPSFAADATDILQVLDVQHAATVSLVQNGGTVFGALGARPDRAAQPDHERGDHVRHHRREQQRPGADLPRVPDLPERDEGHDGQAPDVLGEHRSGDQGARSGRPAACADAELRRCSSRRRCVTSSRTWGR